MPFQAKEREGMLTGWIAGRIFWQLECINLPAERPQPLLELGLVDTFHMLGEERGTPAALSQAHPEASAVQGPVSVGRGEALIHSHLRDPSLHLHPPSFALLAWIQKGQSGCLK